MAAVPISRAPITRSLCEAGEATFGPTAKTVDDKSPLRSARPRMADAGHEIGSRDPLHRLKLILNVPRWIRDFLMVEFNFKTLCRTFVNKATAARSRQRSAKNPRR